MSKKLNNMQKYAVMWLNSQSLSAENISKETKLPLEQVVDLIQEHNGSNIKKESHGPVNSHMKQMMITESTAKRQKVAIMTKEASQISDEHKKKHPPVSTDKPYIFKQP
jgi:hypothetical protein